MHDILGHIHHYAKDGVSTTTLDFPLLYTPPPPLHSPPPYILGMGIWSLWESHERSKTIRLLCIMAPGGEGQLVIIAVCLKAIWSYCNSLSQRWLCRKRLMEAPGMKLASYIATSIWACPSIHPDLAASMSSLWGFAKQSSFIKKLWVPLEPMNQRMRIFQAVSLIQGLV